MPLALLYRQELGFFSRPRQGSRIRALCNWILIASLVASIFKFSFVLFSQCLSTGNFRVHRSLLHNSCRDSALGQR